MELFDLLSVVLVFAALTAWVNCRFLGLPTTIGVMVLALVVSCLGVLVAPPALREATRALLERMDFAHALLDVLLAFLLFAGALHVKIDRLYEHKWIIGGLATVGVLASTFLVGGLIHLTLPLLGLEASWIECLVFGALISPTDPIAVLSILKGTGAPKSLEVKIAGESLFNDGIGVVVFLVIAGMAAGGHGDHGVLDAAGVASLFLREVGGSLVLGLAAGWVCVQLMRQVDQYQVEVLLTLALCAGLYSLAAALHSSGPLAVVVAGLMIGNQGKRLAMSSLTIERLDVFWELVDEILNVVLFVFIGMEILILPLGMGSILAGLAAVPLVLLARFLAVGGAVSLLRRRRPFTPHAVKILTWGGLRGGISVALALSLPADLPARDLIVTMTYVVVVFSIVVQGLTVGRLVRWIPEEDLQEGVPPH